MFLFLEITTFTISLSNLATSSLISFANVKISEGIDSFNFTRLLIISEEMVGISPCRLIIVSILLDLSKLLNASYILSEPELWSALVLITFIP